MLRDRRGVGVAEYALMLFLVVAVVAVAFRYMGKSVKHAGNKTEEQFQGNAAGTNSAGGASSGGAGGGSPAASGGAGGSGGKSGGGGGGGGGGSAGGGGGGGNAQSTSGPQVVVPGEEDEAQSTPLWKIIGGVFLVLFAIGGYFAFRKQSKSG